MKQNYFTLKFYTLFACIFFAGIFALTAQVKKDFEVRFQDNIKGDITFIGNNIVNREDGYWDWDSEWVWIVTTSPNIPYHGNESNDNLDMQYVDIDSDESTFSSSSADLTISDLECSQVVYAGLYWSAVYKYNEGNDDDSGREEDWNQVKLKTPGGNYTELIADEVLFDGSDDSDFGNYSPYACYKDVTSIIQNLDYPNGEYTVANVRASLGSGVTGGMSGGWSLVVIYENPTLIGKNITTFDGYAGIKSGESLDIPVEGFVTLPEPFPVNAKMGVMTLEGDRGISGDQLRIKADGKYSFTNIYNDVNPAYNFFNGSISSETNGNGGVINPNRNPNSENTLGWDVDLFEINNSNNSVIPNDETGVTLRAISTQDKYDIFFTSFDVEIIEPDIKLAKGVFNKAGESIQGEEIQLGQEIQYTLSFDNIGNDDGTGFTIRDVLPLNVDLQDVVMPPGEAGDDPISYSLDSVTNEIIFTIPDEYVIVGRGGENTVTIEEDYTIRMNVKVQENCDDLRDACSNIVKNLGYASYRGVLNDNEITDDPSVLGLTSCLFDIPGSTNFLPDLSLCGSFERTIELCGESVVLTAGNGYDSYQWYKLDGSGNYTIIQDATNQTYTVVAPGTYKVEKQTDAEDCKDFDEIIHVNVRGTDNTSPIESFADQLVTCDNDGSILPKFFLCGTNDDRMLSVNFPDARSLSWEKLDESCEHTSIVDDCPTKDSSCDWNEVGTGDQYLLSGPGEYRLVVTYENGCFNRFYFKAYENSVSPVVTHKDMACGEPGNIEVSGVGSGYEYAIALGEEDYQADELTWQPESFFEINIAGTYGVYIRQKDVDTEEGDREPCLFRGEDVVIEDLVFGFSAKPTGPLCFDGKGSIAVSINGALPQYSFWLKDETGTTVIEEELSSEDNYFKFANQSPGTYIVEVETADGCADEKTVVIPNAEQIDFTATAHDIACDDGSVILDVVDGTGSYDYAIWSYTPAVGATKPTIQYNDISEIPATEYFDDEPFGVSEGAQGTYVFLVTDRNGCNAFSNEVTVNYNPPIEWDLDGTDLSCFQSNDGVIEVEHGMTNGYTLTYKLIKIDGTEVDSEDGVFNNLPAGRDYKVIVTQTYGDQSCTTEDLITLIEPDRLTASAGVSKLPGCNESDLELAEVRITNPLGGTPPYEYSFDNGNNYSTSAIGNLKADTHTLYIKDDADCKYSMEVVIPELPVAPTTEVSYTYNCDGTGNVTVVPSIPDYDYTYDMDGTPVTGDFEDGFTFDDLTSGKHTVTIHYNNPNYATYSNLLNEDFGSGANTTSPYIDPVYCYESQYANDASDCDPGGEFNRQINDGEYSVTSKIDPGEDLFVGWISPNDHTDPTDPEGRYMAINIGGVAGINGVIFKKRVFDVIPHQKISVELEAFNLIGEGTVNRDDPYLVIQLVGTDGVVINEIDTEKIPRHIDADTWINYAVELNPEDNEELDIVIRTQSDVESGNDIAIDDILAYQIPEKCDLTLEVPIEIESKPFAAKIDGVTDALCSGADNGEIEISVNNFDTTQGFQYSIDNGANWSEVILTSPFTISGLSAGDYKILVRDTRDPENCVEELNESIEDPSPLNLSAEVTTPMSCSNNYTATITVEASGGNETFEYRLEGENGYVVDFQSSNEFKVTGLDKIGNYTISVRDSNNCTSPTTAAVELVAPKEVAIGLSTDTCIVDNNGNIYVSVTDGNGGYQFSLDNTNWFNPEETSPTEYTFDELVPGVTYTVYVKDDMGCPASETITLDEPINLSVDAQTSISCVGENDGTLTINVSNFEGSYTYSLDGIEEGNSYTSSSLVIEDISSGEHTVLVTDENGCSVPQTFEIAAPTEALVASIENITPISCITNGSVTISASKGWGSYAYELNSTDGSISVGPQGEATFTNLPAGDYEVTVSDAGGCEVSVPFTLAAPEKPEVTLEPKSDLCYSSEGVTLVAKASKGKSPYQYQLNGGELQSENEFNGLAPGSYTVTVVDSNGCTATNSTAVVINEELQVSATLSKDLDCSATNDAVITLDIAGGYPTYTMDVLLNGSTIQNGISVTNGDTYSTTTAGSYSFVITDSEGCKDTTNVVEVTENTPPKVTPILVHPLCYESANGSIELQISGGFPPYTIDLNGSTANIIGGLTAGTYNYTVTDDKGCETSGSVTLNNPDELIPGTIDLVEGYRCDNTSATIELTGYSGGTLNDLENYEFSLDNVNYQASPIFNSNILPGDYTIYIRDSNDCVAFEDITIAPLNKPTKLNFEASAMTCPALTSDVTITVEGGNTPFNYQIIAPSGSVLDNAENNVFEDLSAGTYKFLVTDAKGCTIEDTYTVVEIPQIDLDIDTVVSRVCEGGSTGSISVFISDFQTEYKYELINASGTVVYSDEDQTATTLELIDLEQGTYTLTVTDEITNCTADITETISAPTVPLGITLGSTPVTCVVNGSITVTAEGGWGDYQYQLVDNTGLIITEYQVSNVFNDITPGDYVVRVKDGLGCSIFDEITFVAATPPTISIETTSDYCYDSTDLASLTVEINGGESPFAYKLNGQEAVDVTGTSFTLSNLSPGDYSIEVFDAFGCKSNELTETIETQLTATSIVSKTLDCTTSGDAVIDVEVSGGYQPYAGYEVSTDGGNNWSTPISTFTGSTFTYNTAHAGTYTFRITDAEGCTTTTEKEIAPISEPVITNILVTDATCYDTATGALDVQIDQGKGVAPYTIVVFEENADGTRGTSFGNQTTNLPAGDYIVEVTDAKSCTTEDTATIGQPDVLDVTIAETSLQCTPTGVSLGAIDVTINSGGTGNFTIELYDRNGDLAATDSNNNPSTGVALNSNVHFEGLNYGEYTIRILDANECETIKTATVNSYPDIIIETEGLPACGILDGSMTVTANTSNPEIPLAGSFYFAIYPYNAAFDPDTGAVNPEWFAGSGAENKSHTFTGLQPGVTYTFVVYDAATNCEYIQKGKMPVAYQSTMVPEIDEFFNVTCKGSEDGYADFTVTGFDSGAISVDYQVYNAYNYGPVPGASGNIPTSGGTSISGSTPNNLPPGEYYIMFTEVEGANNGCVMPSDPFTITESFEQLALTATSTNDNCVENAGQITATASYGTGDYSYQYIPWTGVPGEEPVYPDVTDPNWTSNSTFEGESGDYVVYVKDANNCIVTTSVEILLDPTPEIDLAATNQCSADSGNFNVDVELTAEGIAPYKISVDGGPFVNASFLTGIGSIFSVTGLAPGKHTFTVKDANGCGVTKDIDIYPPLSPQATIVADAFCDPLDNGAITINVSGGSGDFTYEIVSGPTDNTTGDTNGEYTGLTQGDYTFEVTDVNTLCTKEVSATLTEPTLPEFELVGTDVSCKGGSDGTITVVLDPTSVDGPYTYSLDGTTPISNPKFEGLMEGTYSITVTSAKGCSRTLPIIIGEPTALVVSASASPFSCDQDFSLVTATIDDTNVGTPPYTYSFNGGDYQADSFKHFLYGSGNVIISVKDANGCIVTDDVDVPVESILETNIVSTQDINCKNGEELVDITITGGSGNYTVTQLPDETAITDWTNIRFTQPGTYVYKVVDTDTNCWEIIEHTVEPYDLIDVKAKVSANETCSDSEDGRISVEVSGYTGSFNYAVFGDEGFIAGSEGNDIATTDPYEFEIPFDLGSGVYYVEVTELDDPFCFDRTNTVTITQPDPIVVDLVSNVNANCNVVDAYVTVNASGGTAPYSYAAVPNGSPEPSATEYTSSNELNLDPATSDWDVYVMDSEGCIIIAPHDVTVEMDTTPDISLSIVDQCAKENEFEIEVNLDNTNTGVSPYQITVDGGAPRSVTEADFPITLTGLSSRDHTVRISDVNGCGDLETISILPPLTLSAEVGKQPSCTDGGTIDFNPGGGSANYFAELYLNDGTTVAGIPATGTQFVDVPAGDYIVRITDTDFDTDTDVDTGCFIERAISLEEATPVIFSLAKVDVSCHDGSNGSITVELDATNDQPPYTYELIQIDDFNGSEIAGTEVLQNGGNTTFTGLQGGYYRVTVTSERGCIEVDEIEIENPPALGIEAELYENCTDVNGYSIQVNLTDIGTPPYKLSVNGALRDVEFIAGVTVIENLSAGNHTIEIIDNNGCRATAATTVEIVPLNFNRDLTTLLDCEAGTDGNGVITISEVRGSGDYHYTITDPNGVSDNGSFSTSNFEWPNVTMPGEYTISITDEAAVGSCAVEKLITVPEKLHPYFDLTKIDAKCYGVNNGSIYVSATDNGTGPYIFEIIEVGGMVVSIPADDPTPGYHANFSKLSGSDAGTKYIVRATSTSNDCFSVKGTTLYQATPISGFTASVTPFGCSSFNNGNNAVVQAAVPTGGSAVYRYEFVYDNGTPGDTSDDITQNSTRTEFIVSNSVGGTVTATVIDSNGCNGNSDVVVVEPFVELQELQTTVIQPTCNGADGSILVEAILVDAVIGIDNDRLNYHISNVDGSYTDSVTHDNTDPTPLEHLFENLAVGSYIITVTNEVTGCEIKTTVMLTDPNTFDVEVTKIQDAICFGSETGIVDVNLIDHAYTGGFEWTIYNTMDNTEVKSGNETDNTGIQLYAGAYYVEITQTDTPFCANESYFNIIQPEDPLVIDAKVSKSISCTDPGEITVTASGGYGFYEFKLVDQASGTVVQDWSAQQVFTSLGAGTYEVYVRDYKGCDEVFQTLTLHQPTQITAEAIQGEIIYCDGEMTASIEVINVSGGRPAIDPTAGYLYVLNRLDSAGNIISSTSAQTNHMFTGLQAGNYSVKVFDNYGCDVVTNNVIIEEPDQVVASLSLLKGNTCTTGATLRLTAVGGTGTGYQYSDSPNGPWTSFGGGTTVDIDIPEVITDEEVHTYYVKDSEECISQISNSISLSPIRPLEITPTVVSDVSCYGDATGYIRVDVKGGLGNYQYTLIDGLTNVTIIDRQSDNTFSGLPSGVYYVQVDSEDCSEQVRIAIEQGVELTAKEPVISNPICTDELGRIEVELVGGTGEYQYAISPNLDQFQSKNVFEDLTPGTYTIIAQDSKGCNPFVFKEEIIAPPPLAAKANILQEEYCIGDGTGSFELIIEGGTPPYSTAVNTQDDGAFEQGRKIFDGLKGGETYVVFVRDANGCQQHVQVAMKEPVNLAPKAEVRVSCVNNSAANEVEIILAEEGLEDVIYTLDGGADQFVNKFTNVAPGDHTVTVSYFGCERQVDFTVAAIQPLNLSVNESNLNEFTMYPSGGTAPYEYFVDGISQGSESSYVIRVSGVYEVKVIDANGCEQIAQIDMEFEDIKIPNVFTPDGDGNNDYWPPSNYGDHYPNIITKIYDRYGRVVAELRQGDTWNGRYNGTELPTGDYWYVMKLNGVNDDREFVGHFTLYR